MRKFEQQKILELLGTLAEAHGELRKQIGSDTFVNLLADCQEFAVQIGEYIESIEGKGTQTITLLEEYCELLYQASLNNSIDNVARLQLQLLKIENNVKTELKPSKLEVAFLPYNASMWDSLESVWLAANADPCCDAYVVPIPYYERLPNGKLGKMHYDGDNYPKNIPITNWWGYDLETRRPEVIVIHYAYDNVANNATIHPDFYSERLREYCDLLVYIPYFVNTGNVIENHWAVFPGVLNADRVILHSEAERQSYIEQYERYNKEFGWNGRYGNPMEKFIALGSPKYDKVLNTKRDDCFLPDEWEQRLYHKDGRRKKVIFYNTHMFRWIEGGEQYFKKLQAVFKFFRSRDDSVLLWRPHPNTELNFRTFAPQLVDKYLRVVKEDKEAGWGIYDDTSDLHRAIAVSDAYYGDGSSIVSLFTAAGKPVMMQNIQEGHSTEPYILPTCLYVDDEYIWFTLYGKNGLFRMDKQTGEVEFVSRFPGMRDNGHPFFVNLLAEVADTMFFVPFGVDRIVMYNLADKAVASIDIKPPRHIPGISYEERCKFHNVFSYGNKIFFIPYSYPAIICLDVITGQTEYYTEGLHEFAGHLPPGSYCLSHSSCRNHSVIAAVAYGTSVVFLFDMETCKATVQKISGKATGWMDICFDGTDYWLVPKNDSPIVRWNPTSNAVIEYGNFPADLVPGESRFRKIIGVLDYIWLFPLNANMILAINKHDGTMTVVRKFDSAADANGGYTLAHLVGDTIYAIPRNGNIIEEYDARTTARRTLSLTIADELLAETATVDKRLSLPIYIEGGLFTTENFLNIVANNYYTGHANHNEVAVNNGAAGQSIYRFVKTEVLS